MSSKVVKRASDYVILGAGSAGCVLANRLSKAGHTVSLVEAGNTDRGRLDSWTIKMPAALTYSVADARYNWDFYTTPQKHLNNRKLHEPRGKVLGGSSSINAMVYVRGNPLDYERWNETEGVEGWAYSDCLPYFKRAQSHTYVCDTGRKANPSYFGVDGPLRTLSYPRGTRTNMLFDLFEQAGKEAGYPITSNTNGYQQEGFGPLDMTIDHTSGDRCSASEAYLHPLLTDTKFGQRLKVDTNTLARKVVFDTEHTKPRAIGVECENTKTNERYEIRANKEVISCLGAVGSPHILMLSGIGDGDALSQHGVDTIHHNPEVGANLQDHLEVYLQYLCTQPVSIYPVAATTARYLPKRVAAGLEWFTSGGGICASNQFETGAFIRSDKGVQHPDIQYHFIPACVVGQLEVLKQHGFQIHVGTLRPTSRGSIKLRNANPTSPCDIDPNFLATDQDKSDMRKAVRLANELAHQPCFDSYRGTRFAPHTTQESDNDDILECDEKLDEWIAGSSHSAYHLSCTCAMGKVVNSEGQVEGVDALRVVDASIMPSMTSGNLNAPTIMLAEKLADKICGFDPLPQEEVDFFVHPTYKTSQR